MRNSRAAQLRPPAPAPIRIRGGSSTSCSRARRAASPLAAGKVLLRPDDIAWTVDLLSETVENAALIPFAVNAAAHGDYSTLATTYAGRLGGSNLETLARLVPFWVILCSEPWAAFDPAATARAGGGATSPRRRLLVPGSSATRVPWSRRDASRRRRQSSSRAHAHAAARRRRRPARSTANLRGWRRLFPRGRLIVVPGAGHGTLEYGCVQKLIARFVERARDPAQRLVCPARVATPVLTG